MTTKSLLCILRWCVFGLSHYCSIDDTPLQSSLLILLSDLDPIFDQEELHTQLQAMLDNVWKTVQGFGEFHNVIKR